VRQEGKERKVYSNNRYTIRVKYGETGNGIRREKVAQKMLQPVFALFFLGIISQGALYQPGQLRVEAGFGMVPPASEKDGIPDGLPFDDIVHLPLEFELPFVFPAERGDSFRFGKFQEDQFVLIQSGDEVPLYFLSDRPDLPMQPQPGPGKGSPKAQEKENGCDSVHPGWIKVSAS